MSNPYRDKLLSVGVITGGLPSKPKVKEGVGEHGRFKATTDELGNTVTQHAKGDRQDVHIKAPSVTVSTALKGAPK